MERSVMARLGQMVVSLRFGRSRGARFEGESKPVLVGLAMVMVCILGVVYLGATSPGCSSEGAAKVATTLVAEGTR